MKQGLSISLGVLLIVSMGLNAKFFVDMKNAPVYVTFDDANTRVTYETVHHVKEAQQLSTGKGVKIGIIDQYFGFTKHNEIYAGGKNFNGDIEGFEEIDEHGSWMATTLKEIVPDARIYALNARSSDKTMETRAIVNAIDWAIENHLNILTYSGEAFKPENQEMIDNAVKRAWANNIVTTFIHYPLAENFLPYALSNGNEEGYTRMPDIKILHYDYNTLMLFQYENYLNAGRKASSGGDIPYYSFSSMSPVLAGFVAMLMEVNGKLTPNEYKQILINTSRDFDYKGKKIERVADPVKAIEYLKGKYVQNRQPEDKSRG